MSHTILVFIPAQVVLKVRPVFNIIPYIINVVIIQQNIIIKELLKSPQSQEF